MTTHADLVDHATRIFPTARIIAEDTPAAFKSRLFAQMRHDHGPDSTDPQSDRWRLDELYRLTAHMAATAPPPYNAWSRRLFEEDLPAVQAQLEAAGVL